MARVFILRPARLLCVLAVLLCACGGDDGETETTSSQGGSAACPAGTMPGGDCRPAGVQEDGCAAGTLAREGGCAAPGVPSDACAEGFVHDGEARCLPTLPSAACPVGEMAVPGETTCRPVAPCGSAMWPNEPAASVFVDGGYVGMSDGSQQQPWSTIQQAVEAATSGATIAIAAGNYVEDVRIENKSVHLVGRCPDLVAIVGAGVEIAALLIAAGADGTRVTSLAVTGPAVGIGVSGSTNVELDRVWIHDTQMIGLDVEDPWGPTDIVARGVLVESAHSAGVYLGGVVARVEGSIVRASQPTRGSNAVGYGVVIADTTSTEEPASVVLASSVVEGSHTGGIVVLGSDGSVEGSVIRDTSPQLSDDSNGFGIGAADSHARGELSVRASLVERSYGSGIFIGGSDGFVESTLVRDTDENNVSGYGLQIDANPMSGERANAQVAWSVVERSSIAGIFVAVSDAEVRGSLVADTRLGMAGQHGRGVNVQGDGGPASLAMSGCVVERNHSVGVFAGFDTALTLNGSLVRETTHSSPELGARGVSFEATTGGAVRDSIIEGSIGVGLVVIAAHVEVAGSIVRDSQAVPRTNLFGDGLIVSLNTANPSEASADVVGSIFTNSTRAAAVFLGARGGLTNTGIDCNTLDIDVETAGGVPGVLNDLGGNWCGCGDVSRVCKASSASLEAPAPLGSVQ